ncbi:hypothetical protein UPYG_G00004540 [Umbra pygmaea]|uniref:TNFR-Cys domain-containing protein n=1 Tax=Umbra pygmaea TaxID=75934 RepID=A0ABD0XJX1_UMBPY
MTQLKILIWIMGLVILALQDIEPSVVCGRANYRIGDECCPMCSPGNYVRKHCTEYTSTSCVPCVGSTYLDEPNGLTACIQCSNCDPGFGLTVKHPCTPTSDTVCEPLEGFYCTDPNKDGCKAAERHSSCKPGQYISQKGSTVTDTVCGDCTGNTYSNGSFTSCQPHTQCDTLKRQVKPGNPWTDTECGQQNLPRMHVFGYAVVAVALALITALIGVTICLKKKGKTSATELDNVNTEMHTEPHPHTEESNAEVITSC